MFIKITPFETLFFRTGRPFVIAEDTWADVVFPPSPATLYGAIRSFMIFKMGSLADFYAGKYKDELGTPKSKGSLRVTSPFLSKNGGVYFKLPLDLLLSDKELKPLEFCPKPSLFLSNSKFDNILLWKKKEIVKKAEGWLSLNEFLSYLKGEKESYSLQKNEDLFCYEPKIGIARDKTTASAKEAYLYRTPLIRLKNKVSLIGEIEGLNDFPKKGIIQLGGENKGASFEKIDDPIKPFREMIFNSKEGYFKIYFATPTIFEKGWLPIWIDEENLEGEYNGIRVKLILCALGRAISIGGWDMGIGRHKPMRKLVPAGSVYYFKILNGANSNKIKESFHLKNISDINPEEGFGFAIVGEVK